MKQKHWRALQRAYMVLIFSFLYVPIVVMAVFSFNESKSRSVFTGFTLNWYKSLFTNSMILDALALSVAIALISALISTVVGTMAAVGISGMGRKSRLLINNLSYLPIVNPEIITGVSLMLLFVAYRGFAAWANAHMGAELVPQNIFGLPTLLIAHISFSVPYVIFNVSPKLRQLDVRMYEAALDLGCNPTQAFFKVVMPELMPAILSAFLICITYSIDDFIISYFTCGNLQTLPIAIYSMTRKKVSPEINALSTIIFLVILAIILFTNHMDSRKYRRDQQQRG